ncbi:MAG: aldo/keto reductase, partial [Lentisphaerae bacterium]|nr:aldo/keto reductase [Lentisphaerota bacterium]
RVTLVTKARASFTPKDFSDHIDGALARLQVECIDILLLKNIDNDACVANIPALSEVVARVKAQGKIRFAGLSSHSPEHACQAIETGAIDVAEVPYNYANRVFEKVLDLAVARDVGILAMKPLGGGRLFGEAAKGSSDTLETLVAALSFAMSHTCRPVLIPGIGTDMELDRYLEAIPRLLILSDTEKQALIEQAQDLGTEFCRGCGYCRSVCPSGIPIDEILPLLDRFEHIRTDQTYRQQLAREFAAIGADPTACRDCRKCIEECPFKLPVPERLKQAFAVLTR